MASIITEYPKNYQNRIERVCDEKSGECRLNRKGTGKKNRLIGLMAGISIGFAVWGSVRLQPDTWLANGNVQMAQSRMPAVQEIGKAVQRTGKAVQDGTGNREQALSLYAQSAVLMDADSGRILYGKDEQQIRPMASTTKIMTCILALELGNPEDFCEVSKKASAQPKVKLGAPAGSRLKLQDLLYSLMLESHNDSAVVIAEHISGSVEAFARAMNRKAQEIGCVDTTFLTPNGLDAKEQNTDGETVCHSTTAAELAKILRYCTKESPKRDEFLTITRAKSHVFSDQKGQHTYSCRNHNALLDMTQEAVNGKTGFTGEAGYCYAAELSDGDRTFILTLLGCGWPPHKTWKWEDVRTLYRYGKEHFFYRNFAFEEKQVRIPLRNGDYKDWICVGSETQGGKREFRLLVSEEERPTAEYDLKKALDAPVKAGEYAGAVYYRLGKKLIGQSRYRTEEEAAAWDLAYCMEKMFHFWLFLKL